jgi:NAD(P)-dependent dehydrogenase (short-subunit alcohol dehydrogenase family)
MPHITGFGIANMNLFLAPGEAKYITGAEMAVDGGMMAH